MASFPSFKIKDNFNECEIVIATQFNLKEDLF